MRNPSSTERQRKFMCADYGRKKAGKTTQTTMSKRQLREYCMKRKKNPHLTSGKWRFVGYFKKGDIKDVTRILRIHGIAMKVTKVHEKNVKEKGLKEVYVGRDAWRTAYAAVTRLFEGGLAA